MIIELLILFFYHHQSSFACDYLTINTNHFLQFNTGIGVGGNANGANNGAAGGRHNRDTGGVKGHSGDTATDERYKEINARLRKLLSEERKALQGVRTNYAAELRSRTEMEMLLRQCVDDVRKEISVRTFVAPTSRISSRPGSSGALVSVGPPTSSFSQADRERTLELLLSQERVISLIYAKTFPVSQGGKSKSSTSRSGQFAEFGGMQGGDMGGVDAEILHAISMGLSNNAIAMKGREEEHDNDGQFNDGGGGPMIASALLDCGDIADSGNRLPAI